jgi:hypothetical protein
VEINSLVGNHRCGMATWIRKIDTSEFQIFTNRGLEMEDVRTCR